jgi:secreted trypsin-like serine protease
MKRASILALLVLILAVGALPAAAITRGQLDGNAHPNVGAMVVFYTDYGYWQRCSGTLIHERVFLTAGHCTDGIEDETDIESIWVNFDPYALNEGSMLAVDEVITHSAFDWGSSDPHDVALLILSEPADIDPAPLLGLGMLGDLKKDRTLREGGPDGAQFTVVGYGGTVEWPQPEQSYDDTRRVAYSEYVALTPVWLHLSQKAVFDESGTCFGDSGGPIFWADSQGSEVVVAVTSTGDAQCVATGLNYRVDVQDTVDFVAEVLARFE